MQWQGIDPTDRDPAPLSARAVLRRLPARLGADFRRPAVFGAVALAALIAGHQFGGLQAGTARERLFVYGCAAVVAVFGVAAARSTGNRVAQLIASRGGATSAASLRIAVLLIGHLIALAAVLDLLALPVHYFVGGTVIAVVVGVAAQQLLGNLFAGLVLLFARPYRPGEYIRIRSGALGGPHEGTVSVLGLLYTTLTSADGDINIPNSALLASAVGPVSAPGDVQLATTTPGAPHDETTAPPDTTLELPRIR